MCELIIPPGNINAQDAGKIIGMHKEAMRKLREYDGKNMPTNAQYYNGVAGGIEQVMKMFDIPVDGMAPNVSGSSKI